MRSKKRQSPKIEATLSHLSSTVKVTGKGVETSLFLPNEMALLALASLSDHNDLLSGERKSVVTKALSETLLSGALDEGKFRKNLNRIAHSILKRPPSTFYFLGWVATEVGDFPKKLRWMGHNIDIQKEEPQDFLPREEVSNLKSTFAQWPYKHHYRFSISVKARSTEGALEKGEVLFREIRGFIDFLASVGTYRFPFENAPQCISRLPAHPVLCVKRKKELFVFYNSTEILQRGPDLKSSDLDLVRKYWAWMQRRLRALPWGEDLRLSVQNYCAASEVVSPDIAIQKLWTALEIAAGRPDFNIEVTKRIASLYVDTKLTEERLEIFCQLRNSLVHSGQGMAMNQAMLEFFKTFYTSTIRYLLNSDGESLDDVFRATMLACQDDAFAKAKSQLAFAAGLRRKRLAALKRT